MKPGRELDALIAREVFKEQVVSKTLKNGHTRCTIGEPDWYDIQGDMQLANSVPAYSDDIKDAWEIVTQLTLVAKDALSGYNPQLELQSYERDADYQGWCAIFYDRFGKTKWKNCINLAYGETPAHAICLAALKVLNVKLP